MKRTGVLLIALLLLQPAVQAGDADRERALRQSGFVDASAHTKKLRVAILPFDTPRNKPDMEQFGAGTMDSLITALSRVPSLVMIDRGRIDRVIKEQAFAQTGLVDAGTAVKSGRLLGAQTLVSGSIQAAGDQVVITASYTDVQTGEVKAPQQVRGPLSAIFDLQEQLANAFLKDQQVATTPEQQQRITQVLKSTANLNAYDYYQRGRKEYLRFTPEGYAEAVKWYKKAIETDPKYALAQAGLGEVYAFWGWQKYLNGETYASEYQQAYAASQQALALNPDLPEAHRALGRAGMATGQNFRIAEARKALQLNPNDAESWYELWYAEGKDKDPDHEYLKKALALNPDLAVAHASRGWSLFAAGRYDDALAAYKEALRVNPRYAWVYSNVGLVHFARDQHEQAVAAYQQAIKLDPNFAWAHYNLSASLWKLGRLPEVVSELEATLKINPNHEEAKKWLPVAKAQLK